MVRLNQLRDFKMTSPCLLYSHSLADFIMVSSLVLGVFYVIMLNYISFHRRIDGSWSNVFIFVLNSFEIQLRL